MNIPEKYRDIYSQAKKVDAEHESQFTENNEGGILKPRLTAVKSVKRIIHCEKEIDERKNIIETAKRDLRNYGLDTSDI